MEGSNLQALTGNGFQDRRITIILILRKVLLTYYKIVFFIADDVGVYFYPANDAENNFS